MQTFLLMEWFVYILFIYIWEKKYRLDYIVVEEIMFIFNKKTEPMQEEIFQRDLVDKLERIYELNADYGLSGDAYLPGNNEVEIMINKILELKNSQVREQFLLNSEIIEFVTQMDYVKDMVDHISIQKESVNEVAASSEEMSLAIEEIANHVQTSL